MIPCTYTLPFLNTGENVEFFVTKEKITLTSDLILSIFPNSLRRKPFRRTWMRRVLVYDYSKTVINRFRRTLFFIKNHLNKDWCIPYDIYYRISLLDVLETPPSEHR